MAEHFLCSTKFEANQTILIAGRPAIASYATLRAVLQDRVGAEVADLFAEPQLPKGTGDARTGAAWYGHTDATARPFGALYPAEQAQVAEVLGQRLRGLAPLLFDPETAGLVGAALHLGGRNEDCILVADGQPVLINWGLLPPGGDASEASRHAHYTDTLGAFLPLAAAPPLARALTTQRAVQPAAPIVGPNAAPLLDPVAAGQGATVSQDTGPSRWEWVPLLTLLLMAGATILWLLVPGNRLFPVEPEVPFLDPEAAQILEDHNRALRDRLESLNGALAGAQCRADGVFLQADGRTPEGLLPTEPRTDAAPAAVAPDAAIPLPPERLVVPDPQAGDPQTLARHARARTVWVVARQDDAFSTGSGFFVAPNLVITNFHVVEGAISIEIANTELGRYFPAEVVDLEGPFSSNGRDLALLRVRGATGKPMTVATGTEDLTLSTVYAVGYPGDMLENDPAMQDLRNGTSGAIPQAPITVGQVTTGRTTREGSLLFHSASINTGNSGGPLIDACGRVVGVNTFYQGDQAQIRVLPGAIASADLMRFLRKNRISAVEDASVCTGLATDASPALAPTPPDAGSPVP